MLAAEPGVRAAELSVLETKLRDWAPDPELPDWFNASRRLAIEAYFALELPQRSNESWHYGDARRFHAGSLDIASASPGFSGAEYERICKLSREYGRVTCLSMVGDRVEELSQSPALSELGGFVLPLRKALAQHGELLRPYWQQGLLPAGRDKLTAQHYALLDGGFCVYLPKGAELKDDIHLILETGEGGSVVSPHILLIAEARSSARVFIHNLGHPEQERNLQTSAIQSFVGAGAQLMLTKLQNLGPKTDALMIEYARLQRDSRYDTISINLGGSNVRTEVETHLAEPGADARLSGLSIARGRQRYDFHTFQNHMAPHTSSNLLFKSALLGRARASYQGLIDVHPSAQSTDAYQSNRSLVLSPDARSDSSPQLEIEANDVRCTHGSTTSNVSRDEMFYLQTRGIKPELARKLLVQGFLTEVADRIPLQPLRDYVESFILERMA
ncbi:Fe-S cluster assembly protein SufD [bacterium]|nr:Fe-S cluster assembly protein SufD [bacterium]